MAALVSRQPLKALCLHGWRTNSALMKMQTAQLRRAFAPGEVEFTFINGPRESTKGAADPALERLVPGPYYEWWNAVEVPLDATNTAETAPPSEAVALEYQGLAESVLLAEDTICNQGPFDFVVGFSQGGMLATILTAFLEKPECLHDFLARAEAQGRVRADGPIVNQVDQARSRVPFGGHRWDCVVLVGAMLPRDHSLPPTLLLPAAAALGLSVPPGLATPAVHLFGAADTMLPHSQELAAWWQGDAATAAPHTMQVLHGGGHRFPGGVGASAHYEAIAAAVRLHCRASNRAMSETNAGSTPPEAAITPSYL